MTTDKDTPKDPKLHYDTTGRRAGFEVKGQKRREKDSFNQQQKKAIGHGPTFTSRSGRHA